MDSVHIQKIIENGAFPDEPGAVRLLETHISWVILTAHFAFKLKKPLQFSFLDFSTPEKRKHFCLRELELNRRLAPEVYLEVLPVYRDPKRGARIGGEPGEIMDYALKMRRLDNECRMDVLLKKGQVSDRDMAAIATRLARFHASTEGGSKPPDIEQMQSDFADISRVSDFLNQQLTPTSGDTLDEMISFSRQFLGALKPRIIERFEQGFYVDGHGDLHTKNIFLTPQPVIFDCIEFNDDLRRGDILNELAFFCMDLELYGRADLAESFLAHYAGQRSCFLEPADRLLFLYYKWYRANVKVKVNAFKAMQTFDSAFESKRLKLTADYFELMRKYYLSLKKDVKEALPSRF